VVRLPSGGTPRGCRSRRGRRRLVCEHTTRRSRPAVLANVQPTWRRPLIDSAFHARETHRLSSFDPRPLVDLEFNDRGTPTKRLRRPYTSVLSADSKSTGTKLTHRIPSPDNRAGRRAPEQLLAAALAVSATVHDEVSVDESRKAAARYPVCPSYSLSAARGLYVAPRAADRGVPLAVEPDPDLPAGRTRLRTGLRTFPDRSASTAIGPGNLIAR